MRKLIMILAIVLFGGCVSQKKYEALKEELAKYEVDDTFQNLETADVAYDKTEDITSLKKQVNDLKIQKKKLEIEVSNLEEKLKNCN